MLPSRHRPDSFSALLGILFGAILLALAGQAVAGGPSQRVLENFPKVIEGKIVGIADGDTITVLTDSRRSIKIRLKGIDAPERGQDYSKRSKQALSDKIFGQRVLIRWHELDRYKRTLGHI